MIPLQFLGLLLSVFGLIHEYGTSTRACNEGRGDEPVSKKDIAISFSSIFILGLTIGSFITSLR